MSAAIRLARQSDAAAIAAIYAPYCESTPVSFETSAPSPEELAGRIQNVTQHWPWLVLEEDGLVAGYSYAGRHRERAAYRWAVDTAVYVEERYQRRGVGRALLAFVADELHAAGHQHLLSSSQLDEPEPQAWHRHMGFQECGLLAGVNSGDVGEVFFVKSLARKPRDEHRDRAT